MVRSGPSATGRQQGPLSALATNVGRRQVLLCAVKHGRMSPDPIIHWEYRCKLM
ncbi:hypothetical protein DPMN_021480 [Dreissena polymorpha]|uniref:Uncharacterized protein n=1 Tax=Dreissena polymorpha TaxID=45954 RepID=A0A9D4NM86_DREPO|nr:hypothetical protein DPMN_021480 [Dreissena polymorpha]